MPLKISPNALCPCSSAVKYKKCCGRWHAGRAAPTPSALMRSRYSAYALHRVDYVLATTHPDGEQGTDPAAIARFCENTDFDGLEILAASQNGSRGEVEFRASLTQGGKDASFGERSVFIQVDGRWLYHSGARS